MPYFSYIVGRWVQKEGKFCLRDKSMAPTQNDHLNPYGLGLKNSMKYDGYFLLPSN